MRGATLVVLAWNQWPLTQRCLDSLLASDLAAAEVIVVDNGSEDETPTGLARYAGRVRILALPRNLGFVRGMNAGIAVARADDDLVLLNNDLVFTRPDWLGRLRDAAYAAPENGIVGCRQRGPETEARLYHAGGFIEADELWGQQTESGLLERDVGQYPRTRRVQGIAFSIAYLRRDCLDRIGALDPSFHSYFEDTDYCLRAGASGIATVVAGALTLRHDQHGSTRDDGGFRQRLWAASRATFAARWQARLRAHWRGDVLWQGVTRMPAAHAHLARALVRRLDAGGHRMAFEAVRAEVPDAQDFRLELAARRRWAPPAAAAIVCAPGDAFAQARGRARIGIGFGDWERVPDAWAAAARALDRLVVPDAFQRDAFRAGGVDVPIDVVPVGVDRDYCHPGVPAPRAPGGRFVFLAVVEDLARDAPEKLAQAFRAAFDRDEHVGLLLHLAPGPDAQACADALAPHAAADARIRLLANWGYPWYQRAQLMAGADAYVCARRGGGWDPFAAEALACGRVLVASDFGSQRALVRAHGLAVACRLVADPRAPDLRWAEPETDALVARLREAHAGRGHLLPEARARAADFADACDIDATAARLGRLVDDVAGLPAPAPLPRPHRPACLSRPASGQLVVLGMHRGGTSSVAGLLARLGAWAGPGETLLRGPDNPRGHYESAALHLACVRRLAAAGGDWRHPPQEAPAAAIDAFRREAGAVVAALDVRRPWLVKEPRLCLVARELLPLLTRPVFVHVVRDPHGVAASLAARDGIAPVEALALWEAYTRAAFEASRGWPRVLVDYDALLAAPPQVAQALWRDLLVLGVADLVAPEAALVEAWVAPNAARPRPSAGAVLTPAQQALQEAIADRRILEDGAAGVAPAGRVA